MNCVWFESETWVARRVGIKYGVIPDQVDYLVAIVAGLSCFLIVMNAANNNTRETMNGFTMHMELYFP